MNKQTSNRQIRFQTPAKINTFLYIQSKRPDGYHELLMDLIPISFFDSLELNETYDGMVELESNLKGVSAEDNLVLKAVRILEQEIGEPFSLRIKLNKEIPSGAGLGGGSGNAAGILTVLNEWYQLNLSVTKLRQMALKLGADVPFFVTPRPSLAKGIGEQLIELPSFEPIHILLIYPGFPISTKSAYDGCTISGRNQPLRHYTPHAFSLQHQDINDFWETLGKKFPALVSCKQTLLDNGAVFSGLSGSGSTLFGIFEDESTRDRAYSALADHRPWTLVKCKTLNNYNYLSVR